MKKEIELSVIIPIYNLQKCITSCLKSLQNQDIKEAEFLIIDDGSTDNTEKIVKDYIAKSNDKRYKYYRINNNGVSNARNFGMKMAKGKYIAFVDGDDTLIDDKKIYSTLIKKMEHCDLEIIEYNFQRIKNNIKEGKAYELLNEYGPISGIELMEILYNTSDNFHHEIFKFLFNSEFLKKINIQFEDIKIAEDQLWLWQVMLKAKRVVHIPKVYYNYIARDDSVMHINTKEMQKIKTKSVDKSINKLLQLIDSGYVYLTEEQKSLFKRYLIKNYIVNTMQKCAFTIYVNRKEFKEKIKNINLDKKDRIKKFIVLYLPNKIRQKVCLNIFNKYIYRD